MSFALDPFLPHVTRTVTIDLPKPAGVAHGSATAPSMPSAAAFMLFETILMAAMMGIVAWLLYKVLRRRSWARITLTTLSVLLFAPIFAFSGSLAEIVEVLAKTALGAAGLVLLFTPGANKWFRSAREA
jgi:peptidoglycan/LPS O-acetylase OafA/YrhL